MSAGQDGRPEYEPEDAWRIDRGQALHERDAGSPNRRAEHAARCREHHALRHDLLHDPRTAGADRHAYGDLALPRRRARQQQVRDIGADDEEHCRHGSEEHAKRGPQALDHSFFHAAHFESRHVQRRSVGGRRRHDRATDDIRFLQGRREGDPGTQAAEQRDAGRSLRTVDDERRVVIHRAARQLEGGRHDADDRHQPRRDELRRQAGIEVGPEFDGRSHGSWIRVEQAPPGVEAEHDHVGLGGIVGNERAPQLRTRSEHREGIGRERGSPQARHPFAGPHDVLTGADREGISECRAASTPLEKLLIRHRALKRRPSRHARRNVLGNLHQTIRTGKRQRLQEDRVDDAVDGRGGADTERERQHRDDGKAGRAPQGASCVTQVLLNVEPSHGTSGCENRGDSRLLTPVDFTFGLKPAIAMRSSRDRLRLMFSMIC